MRLKAGVRIHGLRTELLFALIVAEGVLAESPFRAELIVTSANEGQHSPGSLHYVGQAADIRRPRPEHAPLVVELIKDRLGGDYDVVPESDHIHIEFQPKRSY